MAETLPAYRLEVEAPYSGEPVWDLLKFLGAAMRSFENAAKDGIFEYKKVSSEDFLVADLALYLTITDRVPDFDRDNEEHVKMLRGLFKGMRNPLPGAWER